MSLDPQARSSWRGLVDLLRPPPGFRLRAAIGTSFGMSFDAVIACLLAMLDSHAENLAEDSLAGLVAVTRLADRVRLFVDAGSISGSAAVVPARLAGLLDRVIVPARPNAGLFHPKLWVVRFSAVSPTPRQADRVRVIVGSRNIAPSSALELGGVFDGKVSEQTSTFSDEVAKAVESCLRLTRVTCAEVAALPYALRVTAFEVPEAGQNACHLRWQSAGSKRLADSLPVSIERAIVLSPFLTGDFLQLMLSRSKQLRVVSTPAAFRRLNNSTFEALIERGAEQKTPAILVVRDDLGDEDAGRFEGLHAKALVLDQGNDKMVTFLGSANGTTAGWRLSGAGNVECICELRPGIPFDAFLREFIEDKKGAPRPWIQEFEPGDRAPLTPEEQLHDELLSKVRALAAKRYAIDYSASTRQLAVSLDEPSGAKDSAADTNIRVDIIPLGVLEDAEDWRPYAILAKGPLRYSNVDVSAVSAFVVVRAAAGGISVSRMAFADLKMTDAEFADRDAAARSHLVSNARTEDILAALVFGVSCHRHSLPNTDSGGTGARGATMAQALNVVTIGEVASSSSRQPRLAEGVSAPAGRPIGSRLQ